FNGVSLSIDERRLAIGTEKGEVLLWDIAEGRVTRRFNQTAPVHAVTWLDDHQLIAAGGAHVGAHSSVVRKWDVESGGFEDFDSPGANTVLRVATDPARRLLAASTADGRVTVWESKSRKRIANWQLSQAAVGLAIGETVSATTVYVTTVDPTADLADVKN